MANIFDSLFKKKEEKKIEQVVQTTPLTDEQLKSVSILPVEFKPAQLSVGCAQSVGMQRDHNEDAIFTLSSVLADAKGDIPFGIFIVADGMGGHRNGEVASGVSARVVARYLINKVYSHVLNYQNESMDESLQEALEGAMNEAQKAVVKHATGGGTTLTVALVLGEQVTVAHVGDSRAYLFQKDGRLQKITRDHSLVQRMVDLEEITEAEAALHPQKNVLLKAVGQPEPYRADIQTHRIPSGGKLLLCSDGLWGVVSDDVLSKQLAEGNDIVKTCNTLIRLANDNGGPDNISVILVDFKGA